jgi:glutamyl-tRNA synthetase
VEDTDLERSTPEAIRYLFEIMEWLGLDYDEEPVYQSACRARHMEVAQELIDRGFAYKSDKGMTGMGEAVLFRMPKEDVSYTDLIKGEISKPGDSLKDFVIVRSDGSPVFHLANVIDDIDMGITHVIRGDDHVENTFRHIQLYRALNAPLPQFGHLPMIVNHQGKPYSKRDGAAFVGEFRDSGYLPEALFNFLSLLGWNPGDDREYMPREELIAAFDLSRVQSSPAQMDLKKLNWMNGCYMADLPWERFEEEAVSRLQTLGLVDDQTDRAYLHEVLTLLQSRVKVWPDLQDLATYFFRDDYPFDPKATRKRLMKPGVPELLIQLHEQYARLTDWTEENLEKALRDALGDDSENAGTLIHPVRVAVSGQAGGPGLFEMLRVIGPERVLMRLDRGAQISSGKMTLPESE